ncbi:hypothetical protein CP10139811_0752 [Chlamydia ibidis]|uniref:Uncharacterized protein n=2 Tax=Chlamydia ibidis TaxID=1405396 RepID=S7J3N8_9CHLA|nr:hypothetical protein CP10139811_0752 [Chlamydia ibidis]EQM63073.1 hypothetical protein H359_0072 [Chlamydia ibidis 10-1398/6]
MLISTNFLAYEEGFFSNSKGPLIPKANSPSTHPIKNKP